MKRLAFFLTLALLCSAFAVSVGAEDAAVLLSDVTATAGNTVTMTVMLQNSPAIVGARLHVGYDSKVMSFVSARSLSSDFEVYPSTEQGARPVKLIMASLSFTEFSGDIQVAELTFKMADDVADGKYNVSVSVPEAYNKDFTPVSYTTATGVVTVGSSTHTHTLTETKTYPTASQMGYTTYSCSCGHIYTGNYTYSGIELKMTLGKSEYAVNGIKRTMDVTPIIRNSRTMLPARYVAEELGATVVWDEPTSTAILTTDAVEIKITVGSNIAYVNGKAEMLDSPAFIENDRAYTPVRFVAEKLGGIVAWDDTTSTAIITK